MTDLNFILKVQVDRNYFLSAYTGNPNERFSSVPPQIRIEPLAHLTLGLLNSSLVVAHVIYFPQTAFSRYVAAPTGLLRDRERFEPRQAWIPAADLLLFKMLFRALYMLILRSQYDHCLVLSGTILSFCLLMFGFVSHIPALMHFIVTMFSLFLGQKQPQRLNDQVTGVYWLL